jgi:hypothetical protein
VIVLDSPDGVNHDPGCGPVREWRLVDRIEVDTAGLAQVRGQDRGEGELCVAGSSSCCTARKYRNQLGYHQPEPTPGHLLTSDATIADLHATRWQCGGQGFEPPQLHFVQLLRYGL